MVLYVQGCSWGNLALKPSEPRLSKTFRSPELTLPRLRPYYLSTFPLFLANAPSDILSRVHPQKSQSVLETLRFWHSSRIIEMALDELLCSWFCVWLDGHVQYLAQSLRHMQVPPICLCLTGSGSSCGFCIPKWRCIAVLFLRSSGGWGFWLLANNDFAWVPAISAMFFDSLVLRSRVLWVSIMPYQNFCWFSSKAHCFDNASSIFWAEIWGGGGGKTYGAKRSRELQRTPPY